jgi:HAE1 family hydrophobic/amphiphilic exporter-1
MQEISAPVIGIALVLSAVFIPTAFIPGITGRLYQQFAVTIAISVILSAFNALTLSPALSALLLKPRIASRRGRPAAEILRLVQPRVRARHRRLCPLVGALIRKSAVAFVLLAVFGAGAWFFSGKLPTSFLPDEDQGYMFSICSFPTPRRSSAPTKLAGKIEKILAKMPGIEYTTTVVGFSLLSFVRTSYNGLFFVTLKDWDERKTKEERYQEIVQNLNRELGKLPDGFALSFSPPAIPGVGTSGGFTFVLEDRAGKDVEFLAANLQKFMAAAGKRPEIAGMLTTFLPSVPQQFLDVDRDKVMKQGVPLNDVYRTIQAYMGGVFINYFNRFGRQWQVYVEAEGDYRKNMDNLGQFYVRNGAGSMVPLSALTKFESRAGPEFTMRYDLHRSAQIIGSAAPGI